MTANRLARRTRRAALLGAVCAGLVAGGAGCSGEDVDAGTNGVGKLPAAKIQSRARQAASGAEAVRLSGSVVSKGRTYKLDMRLKSGGGTGSVTSKDGTFRLLRVGEELYLKAGAEFWSRQGQGEGGADRTAAVKLDGKYVKVPQGDPAYKQLSGFTDKDVMLDGMLTLHGELATGDRGKAGGVRTIKITGDQGAGGTLDVALEGKPYPLVLERGGGAGTLRLSDWNKAFGLAEPPEDDKVDYGKQLPAS